MLGKMMKEKYFCGLDIGSQKIKAVVLRVKDPSEIEWIGAYAQKTYGFRDNAVSDLAEFSDCIHHTISELTKKSGIKFKEVQLGLSGAMIEARQTNTVMPLIRFKTGIMASWNNIKCECGRNLRLIKVQSNKQCPYIQTKSGNIVTKYIIEDVIKKFYFFINRINISQSELDEIKIDIVTGIRFSDEKSKLFKEHMQKLFGDETNIEYNINKEDEPNDSSTCVITSKINS